VYNYPDVWGFYLPIAFMGYMTYSVFSLKKKGNVSITVNNIVNISGQEVEVKTKKTIDWGEQVLLLGEETGLSESLAVTRHRLDDVSHFGLVGVYRLFSDAGPLELTPLIRPPPLYNPRVWRRVAIASALPSGASWTLTKGLYVLTSILYLPYFKRRGRMTIPERSIPSFSYRGYGYREDDGIWYNTTKFIMDHLVTSWKVEYEPMVPETGVRTSRDNNSDFDLGDLDPDEPPPPPPHVPSPDDTIGHTLQIPRSGTYAMMPSHDSPPPVTPLVSRPLTTRLPTSDEISDMAVCGRLCGGREPHLPGCPKIEKGVIVYDVTPGGTVPKKVSMSADSFRFSGKGSDLVGYKLLDPTRVQSKDVENLGYALGISDVAVSMYRTLVEQGPLFDPIEGTTFNVDLSRFASVNLDEYNGRYTFVGEYRGITSLGRVNRAHDIPMTPQTDNFHCLNWLKVYFPEWHDKVVKLTRNPATPWREVKEMMKYQKTATVDKPSDEASRLYPDWSEETFVLEYILRATQCHNKKFRPRRFAEITPDCFKRQWKKFPGFETKVLYGYRTKLEAFQFSREMASRVVDELTKNRTIDRTHYWASIPVPKAGTRKKDPTVARCRAAVCPEFWYNILIYHTFANWIEFMEQVPGLGKFLMFEGGWNKRIRRLVGEGSSHVGPDWIKRTSDIKDHGASMSDYHFYFIRLLFREVMEDNHGEDYIQDLIGWLFDEVVNAKIVLSRQSGGQVLQTRKGLKDGIQWTNWWDSIATLTNFARTAWKVFHTPAFRAEYDSISNVLSPDPMQIALSVVFETHGDNDIRCYHPIIEKFFRPHFIKGWLTEIGMVLKPDECMESTDIRDLEVMGYTPAQIHDKHRRQWIWIRKPEQIWKSLVYPSIFIDPDYEEWTTNSYSYILGVIQCCYIMGFYHKSIRSALSAYYDQVHRDFEYDVNRGDALPTGDLLPKQTRLHEKLIEMTGNEMAIGRLMSQSAIPEDDWVHTLITGEKLLSSEAPFVRDTDRYWVKASRDWAASPEGSEHISTRLFSTDAEVATTYLVPMGEPSTFGSRSDVISGLIFKPGREGPGVDPEAYERPKAKTVSLWVPQDEAKPKDRPGKTKKIIQILDSDRPLDKSIDTAAWQRNNTDNNNNNNNNNQNLQQGHRPAPSTGSLRFFETPKEATPKPSSPPTTVRGRPEPSNPLNVFAAPHGGQGLFLGATLPLATVATTNVNSTVIQPVTLSWFHKLLLWGHDLERYIHPAPQEPDHEARIMTYLFGVNTNASKYYWNHLGWVRCDPAVLYSYHIGQHLPSILPTAFYRCLGFPLRMAHFGSFTGYGLSILEEELIMGDSTPRRAAFMLFETLNYVAHGGLSALPGRLIANLFHWNNRGTLVERWIRHMTYNLGFTLGVQIGFRLVFYLLGYPGAWTDECLEVFDKFTQWEMGTGPIIVPPMPDSVRPSQE
jgi:hypothetical protein